MRVAWPEEKERTRSWPPLPSSPVRSCEHCDARCRRVHQTKVRRVRDLPLSGYSRDCMSTGGPCSAGTRRTASPQRTRRGRIAVLETFARRLHGYAHGIVAVDSTPASSKASTTPSRSSSVAPAAIAIRNTPSRSARPSAASNEEPKKKAPHRCGAFSIRRAVAAGSVRARRVPPRSGAAAATGRRSRSARSARTRRWPASSSASR